MITLGEGLVAYKICAKAEGRSERTIRAVTDAVRYFSSFLGEGDIDLQSLDGQSLRRFILALQSKNAFSNHRFTRPQKRKLSPAAIASYVRSIKSFFSFLAH